MTQPRPKNRSSASGAARKGVGLAGQALGVARAAVSAAARRPGIVLAAVAIVGGGGVFAWNATMKQSSRHPAPLFASAGPSTTASIAPEPPRRPDFAGVAATPRPEAVRSPDGGGRAVASGDPIGSMIKSGEAPTPRAPAPDAKAGPRPRVVSAQKALAKLGYGPITVDGVIGSTTRQALERFERDRKLPVTGVLGQRTARQLASLSGIAVD